jgi:ribose transport system substrate-binding protein
MSVKGSDGAAGRQEKEEGRTMPRALYFAVVAVLIFASNVVAADARALNKVGISLGSLGNPYFVALAKGATAEAKRFNPNVQVYVGGYDYDLGKQFDQIQNFIATGVDLILLNPGDPVAIAPAIREAQRAGIVVVSVDTAATASNATVTTDNVTAGRLSCQYIVDNLKGKGDVIIENGPHVSAVIDRVRGCKEAFATAPGIKLLSDNQDSKGSREGGMDVMEDYLQRFPQFDAVFVVGDPQAIGADLAARQNKRTNFFITSVDGSPDGVSELKDPQSLLRATASQNPYKMAVRAVDIGVGLLDGKKPQHPIELLAPRLITRSNVATYKGWSSDNAG